MWSELWHWWHAVLVHSIVYVIFQCITAANLTAWGQQTPDSQDKVGPAHQGNSLHFESCCWPLDRYKSSLHSSKALFGSAICSLASHYSLHTPTAVWYTLFLMIWISHIVLWCCFWLENIIEIPGHTIISITIIVGFCWVQGLLFYRAVIHICRLTCIAPSLSTQSGRTGTCSSDISVTQMSHCCGVLNKVFVGQHEQLSLI